MKYNPEKISVIIGNEDGIYKVVTGVDPNSLFKRDKYTPETEMTIARDIVEDFNKAILNFPFKVPLSRTTVTFAEDVIRGYIQKCSKFLCNSSSCNVQSEH